MAPNVLLIIADDLNSWIGALGRHPQAHTPNIDALARRGTLFVNAYCSAPYCNASRMGLFTGKLPATLGVYGNEPFWETEDRSPTFVELLRAVGYYTMGAGKVFHGVFDYERAGLDAARIAHWRRIENRDYLWDRYEEFASEPLPAGRPLNRLFDFNDFGSVPEKYRLFDWGPIGDDVNEEDLPDVRVARTISDFLAAPPPRPFFCAAGLYKPHLPWHAPQRHFDRLGNAPITLPLVKADDLDDVPPIGRAWANDPPDHELVTSRGVWADAVRGYLACMSYADEMIGRILSALDASPARDDTIVVVCGDNGFHLGEKLHWRKFALWEEATRVPLIIAGPGLAKGQRPDLPTSLIDLFPTLLALAGLDAPANDGNNLFAKRAPGGAIMTWGRGNHSIRRGRFRYTRYEDGGEELYDLASDPHEWTNLAALDESGPTITSLREDLRAHGCD